MGARPIKRNILWSENTKKKVRKNVKKGVDKAARVWYISKALKRARDFRRKQKIC